MSQSININGDIVLFPGDAGIDFPQINDLRPNITICDKIRTRIKIRVSWGEVLILISKKLEYPNWLQIPQSLL